MTGWEAIHRYPAVIIATLIGTGIWIGDQLPASTVVPLFVFATAGTALTGAAALFRNGPAVVIVQSFCSILLCTSIGALTIRCDDERSRVVVDSKIRDTVTLVGTVADAPAVVGNRV
jgi:hypothetical protein